MKENLLLLKDSLDPSTNIFSDLKSEEIVGTLYEKELKKANQKEF